MTRNFTVDWVSSYVADWTRWLAPFIGKERIVAIEIGSHEGRSACWFCENVLTGRGSYLVCVDPWAGSGGAAAGQRFHKNTRGLPIYVRQGRSTDVLAQLTVERRRYHFAYLDGEHSGAQTLADLCAVWPLLIPGGIIICDDYRWTAPHRPIPPGPAIDSFLFVYADRIAKHEDSGRQMVIWKPESAA